MSVWSRLRQCNADRRQRRLARKLAHAGKHTALYLKSPGHQANDIRKKIDEVARLRAVLERVLQSPCPHPSFDRPAPRRPEPITIADFVPVRPMHYGYSRVVEQAR